MALIYTARDARAPGRQVSTFTPPPAAFDGDLETFAAEYVVPNLPSPDAVAAFHEALAEYVATPDPLLILRTGAERGEIYRGMDGIRFKRSDNAPAWWVHAALVHGHRIAPGAFGAVVATMPTRMFEVGPASAPTASAAGWHTAHMFSLNNGDTNFSRWSRAELVGRFVRNIHPCNYFLLAKTDWAPWGKDPRVIAFFAALYRRRYHGVWEDFVALANVADAIMRVDGPVAYRYHRKAAPPAPARPGTRLSRSAESASHAAGRSAAMAEYRASRLTFKRDIIEALRDDESFRVTTPMGVFEMTKGDLYRTFPGVTRSASYLVNGRYNYSRLPAAAAQFLVIAETERALRGLVRTVYSSRFHGEAATRIEQALPEHEREGLARSLRARPAGAEPLSIVDYLYLGQLVSLLFAPDTQQEARTRLGGAPDVKQRLSTAVAQITPVRNEIAHVREVPTDRLMKASVACADVLDILQKAPASVSA